ncbi:MAG TPA: penicillin acylase family protein [Actinomycetes bacterium]|nr:penicillin acylase family protein [Actinomycetes bacterium]
MAAGAVAIAVIAGTVTAGWLVQRPMPQTSGTLSVAGLNADVSVHRDERGIPTIVAESSDDLFFAQGFVHAQDRFWEMDVRRHITSGRLSEMFGASQVETDTFVRTLGWRRVAEEELSLLSQDTLEALTAYSAGVNAYLAERGPTEVSLEYSVLAVTARDYSIEPWTPADSVAWLKAMAWDLRSNLEEETDRALLVPTVRSRVAQLYPPYPYDRHQPIVAGGSVSGGRATGAQFVPPGGEPDDRATSTLAPVLPTLFEGARRGATLLDGWLGAYGPGVGSNSFAVTGERSASGGALIANDPHLAPSLPGIWYQMNLQCEQVNDECPFAVGGFTFSGVPGVVIGHNDRVAWAFTNNGADVTDLAYEAINGDGYVRDGEVVPFDTRVEMIEVAGGEPVEVTVRSTEWGPMLSDVSDAHRDAVTNAFSPADLPGGATTVGLALKWTALTPGRTADAILGLNLAGTFEEFRDAAASFEVPSQNLLYADSDGHIGYQMPGKIPIRSSGEGVTPVTGWSTASGWRGFIPFEQLPWVFDPPEQYIVAANQAVIDETYPYNLTRDWGYGYRSQRLVELIEAADPLTPESAADLMTDTENTFAPVLVAALMGVDAELLDARTLRARELLDGWDYRQDADSAGAAYYNAVWRHLLAGLFHDELTGDLRPDGGDRWFEAVQAILTDRQGLWWDDVRTPDVFELRAEVLAAAMSDANDELVEELGDDPASWRWGDVHELDLVHSTFGASGIAPLEQLFNRGPYAAAGGEGIVNATGWNPPDGYGVDWVPSMRMVVDLTDLDASRWVQLTGQSGHVFDPHYTDQTDAWVNGDTYPWPFTVDAAEAAATDTLILVSE